MINCKMNIKYRPKDLMAYSDKNIVELIKVSKENDSLNLERTIKGFYELLL